MRIRKVIKLLFVSVIRQMKEVRGQVKFIEQTEKCVRESEIVE